MKPMKLTLAGVDNSNFGHDLGELLDALDDYDAGLLPLAAALVDSIETLFRGMFRSTGADFCKKFLGELHFVPAGTAGEMTAITNSGEVIASLLMAVRALKRSSCTHGVVASSGALIPLA